MKLETRSSNDRAIRIWTFEFHSSFEFRPSNFEFHLRSDFSRRRQLAEKMKARFEKIIDSYFYDTYIVSRKEVTSAMAKAKKSSKKTTKKTTKKTSKK